MNLRLSTYLGHFGHLLRFAGHFAARFRVLAFTLISYVVYYNSSEKRKTVLVLIKRINIPDFNTKYQEINAR